MVEIDGYLIGKCCGLTAYYSLLNHLGLGTFGFKFATYNVASAWVKYLRFQPFKHDENKGRASRLRLFVVSFLYDLIYSSVFFGIFYPQRLGTLMFSLMSGLVLILLEHAKFRLVEPADTEYKVSVSNNLLANMSNFGIACFYFHSVDVNLDHTQGYFDSTTFPVFVAFIVLSDILFAVTHYLEHKVPWLWKKHVFHHKYKKENLNMFANFAADLEDSVMMQLGLFAAAAFCCWTGRYHISFYDLALTTGNTHSKYSLDHFNILFFFEWDFLDCLFRADEDRICCFHHSHHHDGDQHFALFGFVSDSALDTLISPIIPILTSAKHVEEHERVE